MSALLAIVMAVSLALAAFCAAVETGVMSVNRGRIMHLVREGSRRAHMLQNAASKMQETLTALLVGNNFAASAYAAASAALGARLSGGAPHPLWTAASAFGILYLGEFVPKLFFASRPLSRLLKTAPALAAFRAAMKPVTASAMWLTGFFVGRAEHREKVTVGDLVRILQDRKNGARLTDFECALVTRILVLRRKGEPVTVDGLLRAIDSEP